MIWCEMLKIWWIIFCELADHLEIVALYLRAKTQG